MKSLFAALCLAVAATASNAALPPHPATDPTVQLSPVEFFRRLLGQGEEGRSVELARLKAAPRKSLERKLAEYDALSPGARELRLQATELRFYLRPLLSLSGELRDAAVLAVPDAFRGLIRVRLEQWDRMDMRTRVEILDNEWMLHGVLRYGPKYKSMVMPDFGADVTGSPSTDRLEAWTALPAGRRKELLAGFTRFFTLDADEKDRVLERLPEYQRVKVIGTIAEIRRLPEAEQLECLDALRRFVGMGATARNAFVRNAELWRRLSPLERRAWKLVVERFPPLPPAIDLPPVPPGFFEPPAPVHLLSVR